MSKLSELNCRACNKNAELLTKNEIDQFLREIPGWEVIFEDGIQKLTQEFKTKNYKKSVSFTNEVAKLADEYNHHPQIVLEYSIVTVLWWTHTIEGLHKNDFIMAAKTSKLL